VQFVLRYTKAGGLSSTESLIKHLKSMHRILVNHKTMQAPRRDLITNCNEGN